ncbi:MAG: YncE family protein [Polyangiaceae bacterium]
MLNVRATNRAAALFALAGVACTPDPIIEENYLPYEGEAYPDRVEPIAYPDGEVALVTDSYSDTVSVIDLATGERIAVRPVGRNPVDLDGPHHITMSSNDPEFAYIGLSYPLVGATGPHAAHGSSQQIGYVQKLRTSDLSIVGQVRVDRNPGDILISADGSRLVTSHFDLLRATQNPDDIQAARSTVALVDPTTLAPTGSPIPRLITVCVAPHGLAMTAPSGDRLYVACYGEDKIARVDLSATDTPVELFDVGPGVSGFGSPIYGPYVATLSPDDRWVVVSDTVSKDLRFFDTETDTFDDSKTVVMLGAPYFPVFSPDGSKLAVVTQQPDSLVVVDLDGVEPNQVRTFTGDECELPHIVTLQAAGGYAVVCEGDKKTAGQVIQLDDSLDIVKTTPVGVYPDAILLREGQVLR